MDTQEILIIVWAIVIALSIAIEFITYDLIAVWFSPAALISLILAAVDVDWPWQLSTFVVASIIFLLAFRPVVKKFLDKPAIKTNITDVNMGKKVRLLADSVDGYSAIQVNGITWKARIAEGGQLSMGTQVVITGNESNNFIVIEDKVPSTELNSVDASVPVSEKKPKTPKSKPSPKNPTAGLDDEVGS